MKKMHRISLLVIIGLIVGIGEVSWGQSCIITLQEFIRLDSEGRLFKTYDTWDWTIPTKNPNDPDPDPTKVDTNYCRTWVARTTSNGIQNMGAPWFQPGTSILTDIGTQGDYQPEDGWVIIKRDFGLLASQVPNPYFILYNKLRGLMRVFVYVMDTNAYSGAIMTLEVKNVSGSHHPGLASLAAPKLLAADKFLSNDQNDVDKVNQLVLTSVTDYSGGGGQWVMGEFNPQFDPNFASNNFANATFEIDLVGIVTDNITLAGTTTNVEKGYSFTLQKKDITTQGGLQKFFATGAKISKEFKGISKTYKGITEDAKNLKTFSEQKGIGWLTSLAKIGVSLFDLSGDKKDENTIFKTISTGLGAAGGPISIISSVAGTVVGLLTKKKKETDKIETFSTNRSSGTIKLEGSIEGERVITKVTVKVPGTPHTGEPVNEPYYDCPLGLVNLLNTPSVDYQDYLKVYREVATLVSSEFEPDFWRYSRSRERYRSYRGRDDLHLTLNKASGLEILSARVAFVGTIGKKIVQRPDPDDPNHTINEFAPAYTIFNANSKETELAPVEKITNVFDYVSFMLESGNYMINTTDADSGYHSYRTKFVDIECFKGLTFNTPKNTDIALRLQVIFKKAGVNDETLVLYSQDYDIGLKDQTVDPNQVVQISQLPPYANLTRLPPSFNDYNSEINLTKRTFVRQPFPAIFASNSVNVDSVQVNNVGRSTVTFTAGREINLKDGFKVTLGSTFNAKIEDFGFNVSCTTPIISILAEGCTTNNNRAKRTTEAQVSVPTKTFASQLFNAYPNPTTGQVTIDYQVGEGGGKVYMFLSDVNARMVKMLADVQANHQGQYRVSFDTKDLKPGIYFYTLQIGDYTETKRLVIVK